MLIPPPAPDAVPAIRKLPRVRALQLAWLVLAAVAVRAETLYVTESIDVGIYGQPTLEGDRVAVVRSAQALEVVGREGDAAQVRLRDGTEGWIAASYLEATLPLAAQLESISTENARLRAAARAEATTATEVKTLQGRNEQLRSELASAQRELEALQARAAASVPRPDDEIPVEPARPPDRAGLFSVLWTTAGIIAALALGFWWGYGTLERRVRRKYGGLKVY